MSGARTAGFLVLVDCPRCGQPLPLDAPIERASCPACGAETSVPFALWHEVLLAYEARCHLLKSGEERVERLPRGALDLRVTLRAAWPSCVRCGAALAAPGIGAAGHLPCGACGALHWTWPAPPELRRLMPAAAQIVAASPGPLADSMAAGLAQLRAPDGADLLALQCPTCGTQVRVEADGARVIACGFCRAQLFVPDALYRRLYGGRAPRPFFVTFTGPTMDEAEQRRREALAAAEQAERRAHQERARRGAIEAENRTLAQRQAEARQDEAEYEITPRLTPTRALASAQIATTALAIFLEVAAIVSEKPLVAKLSLAVAALATLLAMIGFVAVGRVLARRAARRDGAPIRDPRAVQMWWMGALTLGSTAILAIVYPAEWGAWPSLASAVFLGGLFGVMGVVAEDGGTRRLKRKRVSVRVDDAEPLPTRDLEPINRLCLGWHLIAGVSVVAVQLVLKPVPAPTTATADATDATNASPGKSSLPAPAPVAADTIAPATTLPKTMLSESFEGSRRPWPWRDADVILDFDDGALLASVRKAHEGWSTVPLEHGDVTIDVDLSIRKQAADARYGVVCRAGEKGFYSIEIGSDGRAYAFKHPKSMFASRLGASPKGSGGTRSRLHLHVECIGDALRAYVDGVPTLEVHDATYPRGERVGVIAGKQGKSAEPAIAGFDDFVVRGG